MAVCFSLGDGFYGEAFDQEVKIRRSRMRGWCGFYLRGQSVVQAQGEIEPLSK